MTDAAHLQLLLLPLLEVRLLRQHPQVPDELLAPRRVHARIERQVMLLCDGLAAVALRLVLGVFGAQTVLEGSALRGVALALRLSAQQA